MLYRIIVYRGHIYTYGSAEVPERAMEERTPPTVLRFVQCDVIRALFSERGVTQSFSHAWVALSTSLSADTRSHLEKNTRYDE